MTIMTFVVVNQNGYRVHDIRVGITIVGCAAELGGDKNQVSQRRSDTLSHWQDPRALAGKVLRTLLSYMRG